MPQDLCNITMDNDCPIAMLLPSTTGMGVCSTSLTYFLVNTHDEFLGVYRSATNQERCHKFCYDYSVDKISISIDHFSMLLFLP